VAKVIEVKISGLDKLEDALERAPLRVARNIMRRSLAAAVKPWQQEMISRVRRGWHHFASTAVKGIRAPGGGAFGGRSRDFGVIARSIGISTSVRSDLEGVARVGVSGKAFWAKFLEFGTGSRERKQRGKRSKGNAGGNYMPAFPFVGPAGQSRSQEVLDTFTTGIRSEIEQELGK
jgi:HK97 gp10 family phage protein